MQLSLGNIHVAPAMLGHVADLDSREAWVGLAFWREEVVLRAED